MIHISGYSNRLKTLRFDELTEDPEKDPIWIALRNPRLVPPGELRPRTIATDDKGQPLDEEDALRAMYETTAKLVFSWRVYDATVLGLDELGNPLDQPLLEMPATADLVAKLPLEIINALTEEINSAMSPR